MANIINLYSPSPRFIIPKQFNLSSDQVEAVRNGRIGNIISSGLDMDAIKAFLSDYNRDKLINL